MSGSWFSRWGVNYVYGTWQAIKGLTAIGIDPSDDMIERGAEWLISVQKPDGGWGESAISYWDPGRKTEGESTASQTAWALLALVSAGEAESLAARRGVQYLLRTQQPDGTWPEDYFTGTGFPRDFMIRYHGYRNYFPPQRNDVPAGLRSCAL